jgi:hypothetical protein
MNAIVVRNKRNVYRSPSKLVEQRQTLNAKIYFNPHRSLLGLQILRDTFVELPIVSILNVGN